MRIGKYFENRIDIYIFISMGAIILNLFLSNIGFYGGRTSPPLLIGSMILLALSILLIYNTKCITLISLKKLIPLLIMGILFFIYGIIYWVPTYIMYAFIFIFQLPLFFIAIDINTLNKIIYFFSVWTVLVYSAVVLVCFFVAPLSDGQYCGITINPNLWGECISFVLILLIYSYEKVDNKNFKKIVFILFGITIANLLFSRSRTAMLAVIGILIAYIIYLLVNKKNIKKRLIGMAISIIIFIPVTYFILVTFTPHTADFLGIKFGESVNTLRDTVTGAFDRYSKGINDTNSFSSGRMQIWETYLSKISFAGHDPDPIFVEGYSDERSGALAYAHNTFLQVAYQGGIFVIIMYIIPLFIGSIYMIKNLAHKKINDEILVVMSFLACDIIYMMLSSVFGPYNSFSMIGYWLFFIFFYMVSGEKCKRIQLNDMNIKILNKF